MYLMTFVTKVLYICAILITVMKKYLFIPFLFLCLNVSGQKIESVENDDFENVTRITSSTEKLSKETFKDTSGQTMFYIHAVGPHIYLHLLWQARGPYIVSKGEEAYFLLEDKTKITMKCARDVLAEPGVASTKSVKVAQVLGLNIPYYSKDIVKFVGKKVTKIRIRTSDGYKDFDVLEKNQDKIGKAIELVAKEIVIK